MSGVVLRRSLAPALFVALALAARPAAAQDSDIERARALFDEAGELERLGQWSAAQEKLRAAVRIRETPHLRYALGWALENDDKLLEAKVEYETATRLAAQKAGAEDVGRLATARISEVEKKTPLVQVRVPGGSAAGAQVIVDGRATAMKGDVVTLPVNPGSRVIRIERSGRPPTEQLVYVPRGMVRVVDLAKDESVASRTGPQDRHNVAADEGLVPKDRSKTLPIIIVASGAALVLGGGILFASSSSDATERDTRMGQWCTATACTNGSTATLPESSDATSYRLAAEDAAERGNTKQAIGAVIGGLGLVGVGVGTYLLLRGNEAVPSSSSLTARKILPVAGPLPGGAMAGATIRF